MSLIQQFWYAWPWMGLGMGIIIAVLLFATNVLRTTSTNRFEDPFWLTWLAMLVYLIHQFEEYSCNIVHGQYIIVNSVLTNKALPFNLTGFPLWHFPVVNIAFVWLGVPVAALLVKKTGNSLLGLSYYGFILTNGITHLATVIKEHFTFFGNPGAITGTFIFIPLSIYIIYVLYKNGMQTKDIVIAFVAGFLSHLGLFGTYSLGNSGILGLLIIDLIYEFLPIIFTWIGCKLFKVNTNTF